MRLIHNRTMGTQLGQGFFSDVTAGKMISWTIQIGSIYALIKYGLPMIKDMMKEMEK